MPEIEAQISKKFGDKSVMYRGGQLNLAADGSVAAKMLLPFMDNVWFWLDGRKSFGSGSDELVFAEVEIDGAVESKLKGDWFAEYLPQLHVVAVQEDERRLFVAHREGDSGIWMLHPLTGARRIATNVDDFIEQLAVTTPVEIGGVFHYNDKLAPVHNAGRLFATACESPHIYRGLRLMHPKHAGEELSYYSSYTDEGFLDEYNSWLAELDGKMPMVTKAGKRSKTRPIQYGARVPDIFPNSVFIGFNPRFVGMYLFFVDDPKAKVYKLDIDRNYCKELIDTGRTLQAFIDQMAPGTPDDD